MLQVSEEEVKTRLHFDNPWWKSGGMDNDYQRWPKRAYLEAFLNLVTDKSVNRGVVLMGPRRVGKTVMIHHTIQRLIGSGVHPQQIFYLSLDTPIYTDLHLEQLIKLFHGEFGHKRDSEIFIFFDEVQYLKNWEVHLKSLIESYPAHKFIATGSAAAALRLKSQESGAGRFTDFMLPPLTFAEYLDFVSLENKLIDATTVAGSINYTAHDVSLLNEQFVSYLNYGGYPEAVFSQQIQLNPSRYIKSDIIDKVLLRDLPSLYGISDIQELNRLFTTLAYNTGKEVSLEELSQSSGVAKNTIRRYLEYLEAAFLIKRIERIDQNVRHFKRATTFKVYLTNPSMRAALFGLINSNHEAMGALTETAIFSQWLHSTFIDHIYYARWKHGEIDIVALNTDPIKPVWVVEVKWSNRFFDDPSQLTSVISFVKQNKLERPPWVTTLTKMGEKEVQDIAINFTPSSLYCYMVGKNVVTAITKNLGKPKEQFHLT